jgi:hypothetical protein
VRDRHPTFAGEVEVDGNVRTRIDNRRDPCGVVADEVR